MAAKKNFQSKMCELPGMVHEAGKPSVIVINKWDIKNGDKTAFEKMLQKDLAFMTYYQSIYVSALTGQGVGQIMQLAEKSYQNASKRITTGLLNEILHDAILNHQPPTHKGRVVKVQYITQPSTNPPTFVVFVNDATLVNFAYRRYLENRLRERVDFSGCPIKLIVRGKEEKK